MCTCGDVYNIYMYIASLFSLHSRSVTKKSSRNSLNNLRNKIRFISVIFDELVEHGQVMPEHRPHREGKKAQGAALPETSHLCHLGGKHIN